jgi:hypothetical protein
MPGSHSTEPKRTIDTRRSQRVMARVRLVVRRQADADGLMSEVSHTLVVNAHGALIALAMSVQLSETLVIKNWSSGEVQESRVVHLRKEQASKNEVAIEFTRPSPHFWHIDFPPADWQLLQD